jgi:transcriptional regulator with XRE-family HTH domain
MKFREIRKSKGFTIQYVADNLGVSMKTVMRIENGSRLPKADTLYRLSVLYGVTVDDFYDTDPFPLAPRVRSKGSGASSRKSEK